MREAAMEIWARSENRVFFEALASEIRLKIIEYLNEEEANVKTLAKKCNVSSAIMTSHINKLEEAGIITSKRTHKDGKLCSLVSKWYVVRFPFCNPAINLYYETHIGAGHYTKAEIAPTCGICSYEQVIGELDKPECFFIPDRMNAQLVWFTEGYLEYMVPNLLPKGAAVTGFEFSAELGSEYPGIKNNWESYINIFLNNKQLCTYVSPGDFGDRTGRLTPAWWTNAQYGILKVFQVNEEGVFIDKRRVREKNIGDYGIDTSKPAWPLRFAVSAKRRRPGGLSIFGSKFGEYPQDIHVIVHYRLNWLKVGE